MTVRPSSGMAYKAGAEVGPRSPLSTLVSNGPEGLGPVSAGPSPVDGPAHAFPVRREVTMPLLVGGIDVANAHPDVRHRPAGRSSRAPNTPDGHRHRCATRGARTARPGDTRVVLASTGGRERAAAGAIDGAGLPVALIQRDRARDAARAHGRVAEAAAIDARPQARFARDVDPPIVPPPPAEWRPVRDLPDRRARLIGMRPPASNRPRATTRKAAEGGRTTVIAAIDREPKRVDADLDRGGTANPTWAAVDRIPRSIPGIGPRVSRLGIGRLPDLGRVHRPGIGHPAGPAPLNSDGGDRDGPRPIVGGRRQVRNGLDTAALSAVRHTPTGTARYERLVARGKPHQAALMAVAHELLPIANAPVARRQTWRHPNVASPS